MKEFDDSVNVPLINLRLALTLHQSNDERKPYKENLH